MHLTLIGDSIFDNKSYVKKKKSVIEHLNKLVLKGDKATLRAQDGAVVLDVHDQIKSIPKDTTHLFLSVGGNDALQSELLLGREVSDVAEALELASDAAQVFEKNYSQLLKKLLKTNLPLTVCTVYYPNFEDPYVQKVAKAGLTFFNDVIIRQAFMYGLSLIDLRLLCNEPADYANPIEPSEQGGYKIAARIINTAFDQQLNPTHPIVVY